jgi:hypothetical protein
MRICGLMAGLVVGLAGTAGAMAADLAVRPQGAFGLHYSALGDRVEPFVIYDYEPGIVVRAYWLPPWRNRHYFPTGGKVRLGRLERVSAARRLPPAETFYRSWSTSAFIPDGPREPAYLPELPPKPAYRPELPPK